MVAFDDDLIVYDDIGKERTIRTSTEAISVMGPLCPSSRMPLIPVSTSMLLFRSFHSYLPDDMNFQPDIGRRDDGVGPGYRKVSAIRFAQDISVR